ncbi:conserved Plasmodium protein, unknown function [Plasmodium berghei]|uniref:WD repeat-containing protein n=3 Tax=Plasmodium berghei TaxID=5821 RepID=A0A509AQC9_PLABA|nr:conserved Plasmodium protein, unknown function [Plasmodium berghei ANKA]CXJ01408.1 conserved Plasmodium protein, unknown function [Plasmodium berghei]SCM16768.1 conserved Plasmodium protein, unknown function [Plasmodium berghei]VUC57882.1 conserved Plasmodium protein, unknown function [Plasmodium berghei ANKA]|eukprot:XP_034423652.1 conserved Plasmodium protein, unknown function [Plasmodium berghei ANKA]
MDNDTEFMNKCFKGGKIFCFYPKIINIEQKNENVVLHNCIQTLLSDPIVVLYTDDNFICTGTITGKVCLHKITKKVDKETNTKEVSIDDVKSEQLDKNKNKNDIKNEVFEKYQILCMFRPNSIKSIYIDKKYIYIYYESCIDVFCIKTYNFIRRIDIEIINNKQAISFENLILFNNSKSLFIYDITNNYISYFYKNFLKNIVIFDFNTNYLLCYKNNFGKCHIRVLQIYINDEHCQHELIFCVDFSSKFISHGKFLDDEKIIVAKNGKRLIIFDFKKAVDMYRIKKLKTKVLDIYKSAENMLFILVENQIYIFNLSAYIFYKCIQLPIGLFYFKWPYFIRYKNNKIIFSSDRGIYYIDYHIEESE